MPRVFLEYLGDSVELPLGETVVGRDATCALRFNDPAVSRKHVRFIQRHDEVFVEDLGSSNGTLVNGRSVHGAVVIADGDTVSVGTRLITVRVSDLDEEDQPSTFLLAKIDLDDKPAPRQDKSFKVTSTITAITMPPPISVNERCPKCGSGVSEVEMECLECGFAMERTEIELDPRPGPANRRRHDRLPVELRLIYVSSELEVEVISRDLSESGVFVCSQVLDPVGTPCTLTILVDGGPAVDVRGIVRRVVDRGDLGHEIGLGVEFTDVRPEQLQWIRMMIGRLASDQSKPAPLS